MLKFSCNNKKKIKISISTLYIYKKLESEDLKYTWVCISVTEKSKIISPKNSDGSQFHQPPHEPSCSAHQLPKYNADNISKIHNLKLEVNKLCIQGKKNKLLKFKLEYDKVKYRKKKIIDEYNNNGCILLTLFFNKILLPSLKNISSSLIKLLL